MHTSSDKWLVHASLLCTLLCQIWNPPPLLWHGNTVLLGASCLCDMGRRRENSSCNCVCCVGRQIPVALLSTEQCVQPWEAPSAALCHGPTCGCGLHGVGLTLKKVLDKTGHQQELL